MHTTVLVLTLDELICCTLGSTPPEFPLDRVRHKRAFVKAVNDVSVYERKVGEQAREITVSKRALAKAKTNMASVEAAFAKYRSGPRELRQLPDRTKRRNRPAPDHCREFRL